MPNDEAGSGSDGGNAGDQPRSDADHGKKNRALLVNTLWRLAQVIGGGGFSAATLFVYTFFLPKEEYGIYGVAASVAFLFQMVGEFGLRQTVTRFVARARGEGRLGKARTYMVSTLRMLGGFSVGAGLLLLASYHALPGYFGQWPPTIVPLLATYVVARCFSCLFQGMLEGGGHFKTVSGISLAMNLVAFLVVALVALTGLDIVKVFVVETVVAILGIGAFGFPLRKMLHGMPRGPVAPGTARRLLWFALPLLLNAFGGYLYMRVDMLFIQAYLSSADAADYYLMMSLQRFPLLALGSYIYVLNTDVSHALGAGDVGRIRGLFWKSEGYGAGAGVLLAAAFFGASYLIPFALPEYGGAMVLMRIAAPLFIIKCAAQVASGAFIVSLGRPGAMAALTVSGGVLNVILNFVFIPAFAAPGAVYSTLIGHSLVGIATMVFVVRWIRATELKHAAG